MTKGVESQNKSDENQALRIPKTGKIGNLAKKIVKLLRVVEKK